MWNFIVGVLSSWVANAIGASAIGGAVILYLKKTSSPWLIPLCWGIVAAVVIIIGVGALRFVAIPFPPRPLEVTTPENVEARMRTWVDTFHMGVQKMQDDPKEVYSLLVTNRNGRHVLVHRSREFDRYMQFQVTITISPEDQQKLAKQRHEDVDALNRDIAIELARDRVSGGSVSPSSLIINKAFPIETLTENTFAQAIDEMDFAEVLVLNVIRRELDVRKN